MTTSRRPALGRGLAALIPSDGGEGLDANLPAFRVSIDSVRPANLQPRSRFAQVALDELANSIRENGILQPILVRRASDTTFTIIAGERRWRAAALAGLSEVPVVVRDAADSLAYELALIENVQRADLGPVEEATAYAHLLSTTGATQEDLARRVGKDRATISNALRLLRLPEEVRVLVENGGLSAGHARALLTAQVPERISELAHEAVRNGWSVRETERASRSAKPNPSNGRAGSTDPTNGKQREQNPADVTDHRELEGQLRTAIGAPVSVIARGGTGHVEIRFHSPAELERIVDLLLSLEGR